jgi:hypothetical protein
MQRAGWDHVDSGQDRKIVGSRRPEEERDIANGGRVVMKPDAAKGMQRWRRGRNLQLTPPLDSCGLVEGELAALGRIGKG